ncbi:metal ABC transporter substrate-binding protein [Tissierella sp. MB52-C2]|uniref:metal ABC transporter substrate-binding protein n=1 Tax=Tissierella sp. MB52-C2 TaxID=3070999 RepID=UPI00280BB891|nr:metal ABC transporter substrate-binding protein [Tissierella sp. MB52-C2]WMM25851.1 metal ABC transporter substrate-binding protein [Tissierella sp. MB52-C2]
MKRFISITLVFFIFVSTLIGCSKNENTITSEKISVVATIFPQYDFVREIAGENVELTMLLPPGSESHSFEPTPRDIAKIQDCDMFIYVGGDSDSWIKGILESIDTSKMKIISLMDTVDVVEEEIVEGMENDHGHDHDHDDDHHEESEYDEHVWTSPRNAKIIVQAISEVLCDIDKDNSSIYRQNTTSYVAKLDELNMDFKNAVDAGVRKTIVFGDRFPFRYFADEYGLEYFAAFPGCSTETEPSAGTIAFLIDKVKTENIPVVFNIELSNEKMADIICEATGAKKLLLHACHNIAKSDFEKGISYLDLMTANLEAIKEALK